MRRFRPLVSVKILQKGVEGFVTFPPKFPKLRTCSTDRPLIFSQAVRGRFIFGVSWSCCFPLALLLPGQLNNETMADGIAHGYACFRMAAVWKAVYLFRPICVVMLECSHRSSDVADVLIYFGGPCLARTVPHSIPSFPSVSRPNFLICPPRNSIYSRSDWCTIESDPGVFVSFHSGTSRAPSCVILCYRSAHA